MKFIKLYGRSGETLYLNINNIVYIEDTEREYVFRICGKDNRETMSYPLEAWKVIDNTRELEKLT